jgi:hypothetical protein
MSTFPGGPRPVPVESIGHRGRTVSSAILYLAIVSIWAVALLPRWIGWDSDSRSTGDELTTAEMDAADGEETAAPAA